MSLNNFEILQKLGNEEKSSIFKVKRKKDGLIYILKTVKSQSLDKSEKQSKINEIKIVSSLSHPNIIEFKEAFFDKFSKSINIIFEYPHNGNLSNKINYAIKNRMYMEESIIWDVLTQILNGVNYLHKKGIIHRNLKSKNILMNNQRLVKISDFEASCVVVGNNKMIIGQVGTPFYTAPEIWEEEPYNYKCDIWSIGCIIYEMASLTLPFKGDNINSLYENIMSKKIKPIPDFYSEDLKKIINYMLIYDPSKRLSTDLLLNYPRIKEQSAKLKDIYLKYRINKNSRNSKNKVNTNIISKLRTQPGNKGRDTLKKTHSIRVNNHSNNILHTNIIDNNIINNRNMTNKSNIEINMYYTKKDNANVDYNQIVYNRTLSNKKAKSIKAKYVYIDNDSPDFKDKNISASNIIKINDSFLKGNNKIDNGNCGNHSHLKMPSNNIIKPKKSQPKYQNINNIDTNNISKKRQYTIIHSTLPFNGNARENLSGKKILKNNSKLPLHLKEFINKNPINFNEYQILSNNNKVIRYKNNLLDLKFHNRVNSYTMEMNTNYLQECEDILSIPRIINHSNLNRINKLK